MQTQHDTEKFVIISDAHLLQSYIEIYDPILDFKDVLQKIAKLSPDFILIAGDMFDKRKTETSDVRHPEGEAAMMRIREIFDNIKTPIYAICGNHEDERVLRGLQQTVKNFHYSGDRWERLGSTYVYLMNTRYEAEYYDEKLLEADVNNILESMKKIWKAGKLNNSILICHEWIAEEGAVYPRELLQKLLEKFTWVLNGHMHFFAKNHLSYSNLVCLPSLLPSRVLEGKYWTESYSWEAKAEEYVCKARESPFGFVELEIGKEPLFHRFDPSVKIVDLEIDVTGLDLQKARARLKQILDDINKRAEREKLIILPSVVGSCSFSPSLLEDICKAYETLNIEKLRDRTGKVSPFAPKVAVKRPILTVDQLKEEILRSYPELIKALNKARLKLSIADVREICKALTENPYVLQKSLGPVHQHAVNILEAVTKELEKKKAVKDLPPEFLSFLAEQCRKVL
jgi:DNA repair exonuclease SbcCD nuclease subunit